MEMIEQISRPEGLVVDRQPQVAKKGDSYELCL